jgi:hypothetical protein
MAVLNPSLDEARVGVPIDLRIAAPEGVRKLSVFGPLSIFLGAFRTFGNESAEKWAVKLWGRSCQAVSCSRGASFILIENLCTPDGAGPHARLWCAWCAKGYATNHGIWPGDNTLTLGLVPDRGFFEEMAKGLLSNVA